MSAPWPRSNPFVVHKFGGTSVGTPDAIRQVVDIVETALAAPSDSVAVVVSAMGGKPKVTDMLLDLVSLAAQGRVDEYSTRLNQIEKKHMDAIEVRAAGSGLGELERNTHVGTHAGRSGVHDAALEARRR